MPCINLYNLNWDILNYKNNLMIYQEFYNNKYNELIIYSYHNGEHAPSIRTCETLFRQFKSGDFNVKDKCEDGELQALLDDDPIQTTLSSTMINLNHVLIEKRPEWAKRHGKLILLLDSAPSHITKLAKHTLKLLGWDILPPPP